MQNLLLSVSASAIWGKIWPILFAILFFGVIIALHEFGHFFSAKLFGIKVNEFAIGMGPALFKKKKGETLYALRLLPIGGFVSLEGEDEASDDPRAFSNQKAWKRFIVIAAGATLNIILGIILMCLFLILCGSIPTTEVSDVTPDLYTEETGFLEGDRIIRVDGIRVFSANDFYYCAGRNEDNLYDITLKRDGKTVKIDNVPVYMGISEDGSATSTVIVGDKKISVFNLIPGAVNETLSVTKLVFLSLIDMLGGKFTKDDLAGPIGTIGIVAETASDAVSEADYSGIVMILAFITVNIGIVNLLPLPALDGGRLFFIIVEFIFRKPVPKKFEAIVHAAGLIILLIFMALISLNDIIRIIRG